MLGGAKLITKCTKLHLYCKLIHNGFVFNWGYCMAEHTFFQSTPYNIRASKQAKDALDNTFGENKKATTMAPSDHAALFHARDAIASSLKIYAPRLADIDPATFKYKNKIQLLALERELMNTFYLLYDECQLLAPENTLPELENNLPLLRERGTQLERCANLLYRLRNTPTPDEGTSCEKEHQANLDTSPDKPVKYIGLTLIAPLIAETMLSFSSDEALADIIKKMSAANLHRLNWVWGGGLDCAILEQIPAGMGHPERASQVFAAIAPFTGYMSWVLYYLRLGINLYLLSKGTLKGSWMDPWRTEADIAINMSIYERFQAQWHLRKFAILNDAFWATANMACFLWLIGAGILGYIGNVLTFGLLGFDLCLSGWNYAEQETAHNKAMQGYQDEIIALRAKINALREESSKLPSERDLSQALSEDDETEVKILEEHLSVLVSAQEKCDFEWTFSKKNLTHDLIYAAGLMMAFSMLCCFFFPPAALLPATIAILGITGAALSFALTIAYHAWTTNTEIQQLQALSTKIVKKMETLDTQLEDLIEQSVKADNPHTEQLLASQINGLLLDKTHLIEDLEYRQSMIAHHKKELAQQILSEILVPASAFACFVFLPIGLGLPILIPLVVLLMMSGTILDGWKPQNPKEQPLPGAESAPSP